MLCGQAVSTTARLLSEEGGGKGWPALMMYVLRVVGKMGWYVYRCSPSSKKV